MKNQVAAHRTISPTWPPLPPQDEEVIIFSHRPNQVPIPHQQLHFLLREGDTSNNKISPKCYREALGGFKTAGDRDAIGGKGC